jgi:hypothetical protein
MNDTDRLELLDRIADRVPELDLDQNAIEWTTLEDGHEALLVNGGGIGAFFANLRRRRACGRMAGAAGRGLHRLHHDQAGWQP